MLSKRVVVALCCLFALCFFSSTSVMGQAISTGTIQGVVTDPTGATVAGATVTLTNTDTSTSRTAVTNESGRYVFANIPPAKYDVSINKTGFRVTKVPGQELTVGATITLDLKLEIGSTTEIVEVFAASAAMETATATAGNTVPGRPLDNLPRRGPDVSTFVTLHPGVAPDGSVAGANQDQNYF